MPGLFSIAYADLRSRRLISALTIAAIALGAAVVVATFSTNVAVEDSMARAARAVVGNADIIVDAVDDRGFDGSALIPVGAIPGVTVVAPEVHRRVFFRTPTQRGFVEVIGVDPLRELEVRTISVAAGRYLQPNDSDGVVVGTRWAAVYGATLGGRIEFITADGARPFTVVGLADEEDLTQRGSAGTVRMTLSTAQSAFGLGDRVQRVRLKLADPAAADDVKARLAAVLPYVFVPQDARQILDDLRASIRDFQVALVLFGAVALLAGGILVFNTLSLTVAERRRQLGLLRAIGAPPVLVMRLLLAQGLLLGIAGALVGVVLGQALAVALAIVVAKTQGLPLGAFPFSPVGALVSVVLAIGVTVFATLLPALRAGRTPPLAAMSATRVATAPSAGPARVVAAPITVAVGLAALMVRRFARGPGLLAERTVRKERGQTTLTVASFVIALGLIVALSGAATSFTTAGERWADELFPGQAVVSSPVDQPLDLVADFAGISGVDQVSAVSEEQVVWQGVRLTAVGVDATHYFQAFEFAQGERTAAFKQMRKGDGALISAALAQEMGLKIGDPLPLSSRDRPGDFVVAGIIVHSLPTTDGFGAVVVARESMEALFGVNTFRFLAVSAQPGADLAALDRDLRSAAESYGMQARTRGDLARGIDDSVGALFAPLAGLVAIGVIVGALGLANTMVLTIALRRRELGILRAVGMATAKVRGLAIAEASILGFVGAVLGVILGAFLTLVLVTLSRTADVDPQFAFSVPVAVGVIVAGVLVAIVAALYPARIAARTEIVTSVREG